MFSDHPVYHKINTAAIYLDQPEMQNLISLLLNCSSTACMSSSLCLVNNNPEWNLLISIYDDCCRMMVSE